MDYYISSYGQRKVGVGVESPNLVALSHEFSPTNPGLFKGLEMLLISTKLNVHEGYGGRMAPCM